MNLLLKGNILQLILRNIANTSPRYVTKMPDPMEHATGLEKRELLAIACGDSDPWDFQIKKRGPGTMDNPNLVPSAFKARLIGCICDEEDMHCNWMWLHKGTPKRCECGFWFKLVEKEPL